jgi:transcription elongation factor SPT5
MLTGTRPGDTGLIVRVEEDLVIMFSDLTMHELKVLPKDVQLCADVATGVDSLGQYSYGDLVMLDQMTVGVVVRLEKDALQVLNMLGRVVRVRAQAVHGKRHSAQAVALDSAMNAISVNDTVTVVDGPNATLSGQIKHVFRSFVFIYSRTYPEHGGVFVCRARHLLLNTVNGDAMRTGKWGLCLYKRAYRL